MGTEENAEAQKHIDNSILFSSPMMVVITLYYSHGKTPMDCHLHTASGLYTLPVAYYITLQLSNHSVHINDSNDNIHLKPALWAG